MSSINRTDRLYITATSGGATIMSSCVSGMASIGEVYKLVKTSAAKAKGVITLCLRNSTQGWSQQHTLVLSGIGIPKQAFTTQSASMPYPSLFGADC